MSGAKFLLALLIASAAVFGAARLIDNAYVFFAGYVVLQYIALATAWNILGGYTGYVNFGTAAFFALGAYTTVVLHKLTCAAAAGHDAASAGSSRASSASAPAT